MLVQIEAMVFILFCLLCSFVYKGMEMDCAEEQCQNARRNAHNKQVQITIDGQTVEFVLIWV